MNRRDFLRTAGGATAAVGAVGASGSAAAQSSKTVVVGPGGSLVFEPAEIYVAQGGTVTWNWESDGHNIVVDSQPEGASWEGTAGGATDLYDTGHTYEHTFETTGEYEYACEPHRTAGMLGTVEVVEEISTPAPDAGPPPVPDSARTLGIAAVIGMVSTLGLAYFLMRFGGDYDRPD